MIIKDNILIPQNGKILTNGTTLSDKVYLGFLDSPSNWYQVDTDYVIQTDDGETIRWDDYGNV